MVGTVLALGREHHLGGKAGLADPRGAGDERRSPRRPSRTSTTNSSVDPHQTSSLSKRTRAAGSRSSASSSNASAGSRARWGWTGSGECGSGLCAHRPEDTAAAGCRSIVIDLIPARASRSASVSPAGRAPMISTGQWAARSVQVPVNRLWSARTGCEQLFRCQREQVLFHPLPSAARRGLTAARGLVLLLGRSWRGCALAGRV